MKKTILGLYLTTFFFQSCGQKFTPSPEYIIKNKAKWTIEIPEVQELIHIVIAITPTGVLDSNMVEHNTRYYKSVMKHFNEYRNHEIVRLTDKVLKKGFYAHLKMDACGFYFYDDSKIVKDKTYNKLNWNIKNQVDPFIDELEDFATKTNFRDFYRNNRKYYDELIEKMKSQTPIDKQWKWLEARFPDRYDNYRVTFSPLVNASHSTNRFQTDNFKQSVMFICGPIENITMDEKVKEGLMTRVVFTEIDHNYVNPVSDKFKSRINDIFNDRDKWTSGKFSSGYGNPNSVFNEYMTWAVFSLYAQVTFDESVFRVINERMESQMTTYRGFSHFREFNQKLIQLYRDKKENETISDLYPKILEWCRNE
jgi:hypothetical protein